MFWIALHVTETLFGYPPMKREHGSLFTIGAVATHTPLWWMKLHRQAYTREHGLCVHHWQGSVSIFVPTESLSMPSPQEGEHLKRAAVSCQMRRKNIHTCIEIHGIFLHI